MSYQSTFLTVICIISALLFMSCSENLEELGLTENEVELLTEDEQIIQDLNDEIIDLSEAPLELNDNMLAFMDQLSDAKIIGMGEASHGTKQFFDMKHRMFRYLVENHDFKAIVFEMDMGEALIFNDWVQYRTAGDITTIMVDKMLFNVWRTEEVRGLLMWMRDYNNGKEESEMIGFYGVDLQYPNYNADALIELISKVDTDLAGELASLTPNFKNILSLYRSTDFDSISPILLRELVDIGDLIDANMSLFNTTLTREEVMWVKRLYRNMVQVEDRLRDVVIKDERHKRDLYMAENTSWYLDLLGANSKVALWAHNLHVANDPNFFPNNGTQGWHLKSDHGSDYKVIGFSFSKGTFTANVDGVFQDASIDYEPLENTSAWYFTRLDYDNFVLSTSVESQTLKEWIEEPIPFRTIGAGFNYNWIPEAWFYSIDLPEFYDFIIHFNNSEPTSLIPL